MMAHYTKRCFGVGQLTLHCDTRRQNTNVLYSILELLRVNDVNRTSWLLDANKSIQPRRGTITSKPKLKLAQDVG